MNINTPFNSQIPALRNLWQEAFHDSEESLDAFYKTAFSPKRCRCVTVNDTIVAALYWFDCLYSDQQIAYLYAVATAKAYRGQYICHKLMENTHLHLSKLGYDGAILVPGNKDLFRLYENIGYRTCSYIKEFCCTAGSKNVQISCIDQTDYAKLRRHLLPKGSVIQESENLDFLRTYTKFYAGSDFLLAAYGNGNTLYGVELLGNKSAASGIVQSLGYSKGIFRTPGDTLPFAMYYPLGNSTLPAPTYFGLAFDL